MILKKLAECATRIMHALFEISLGILRLARGTAACPWNGNCENQ